ncbi:SRPBCC family protein [Nitrogeniibacter mangrovi]|uniref:SRPBCC family protein n=1 Tax=Nitrogeniibacter mangrovi TaxID=2016596 RepID=A0A6C1B685_9RHOO|nr:SRPBCC family protein [Nitrogeniibacter mangrovi]QID19232.1 SRPBCC family protein [Nitrogeniibacter mangrovi]
MTSAQFKQFAPTGDLSVEESTTLHASPADVWAMIGTFADLDWHPAIIRTEIVEGLPGSIGAIRQLTTGDGAVINEELLWQNDAGHMLIYRIVESPLPVDNYVSEMELTPDGDYCRFTWRSRFDAKEGVSDGEALDVISGIYRAGIETLLNKFGGTRH